MKVYESPFATLEEDYRGEMTILRPWPSKSELYPSYNLKILENVKYAISNNGVLTVEGDCLMYIDISDDYREVPLDVVNEIVDGQIEDATMISITLKGIKKVKFKKAKNRYLECKKRKPYNFKTSSFKIISWNKEDRIGF